MILKKNPKIVISIIIFESVKSPVIIFIYFEYISGKIGKIPLRWKSSLFLVLWPACGAFWVFEYFARCKLTDRWSCGDCQLLDCDWSVAPRYRREADLHLLGPRPRAYNNHESDLATKAHTRIRVKSADT